MNRQKIWLRAVLYMAIVGIGLLLDTRIHASWPSLACVLLVIALAIWDKKTSSGKRVEYKGYLSLVFPDGFHKPQAAAVAYGAAVGGFVGGLVAAGYTDHQSIALIAFGGFGGAVVGIYLLLQLIPITKNKRGR